MLLNISNDTIVFSLNPHQVTLNSNTSFIPPSLTSTPNPSTKALERRASRVFSYSKATPKDYFFSIYSVKVATFKLLAKYTRYKET